MQDIKKLPLRLFYYAVGKLYREDNKIAMRLFRYFPTYRSSFVEILNQLHRVFRKTSSYDVQGLQIEPTNACNLRCRHCTTQTGPNSKNKKGFMGLELFKKIIDDNPQVTCLILTLNGEPLTHRKIFDMIRYARDKGIYVSIYSNGMLLNEKNIPMIFESGLSEITFSMEGIGEYYEHNRGKPYKKIESIINKVLEKRNKRGSKLIVVVNATFDEDIRHANIVKETWEGIVDHVMFEPLMGGSREQRTIPCRTLWRNLVVMWNGDVVPCCVDMYGKLVLGNVNQQSLREIFNSPKAQALRKRHLRGDFPKVCSSCHSIM